MPAWYPTPAQPMSGVFVRDQALAAALHHDVAVVADDGAVAGGPRFSLRDADEPGLRVLRARHRRSRSELVSASAYVRAVLAAVARLDAQGRRPDVLHAHVYLTGIAALIAGRRHRIPVVVSEHSSHFPGRTLTRGGRARARLVFRAADLVCPVSEFLREAIVAQGMRARFRVVPNAIDAELFATGLRPPERDADGRARVVAVSGLHAVKGVATLIGAVARVAAARDDFRVDVIGDGPERARCEQLIAEHGLGERVALLGYLPKSDVAARLRGASFAVQPSRTETFGVAVAEALAAGRPVLAARVGALPEILDEHAGLLVPEPSEQALAGGLATMLDSFGSFDHARMSERAVARFGRAAVAAQWDEVYRGVARAGG